MRRTPRTTSVVLLALAALAIPVAPAAARSPAASSAGPLPAASPAASFTVGDPALARAVETTVAAGTVRTGFSIVIEGSSLIPEGTTVSGHGQTTLGLERRMRLHADMRALGVGVFDLILDGTMLYLRGLPMGDDVPQDRWLVADLSSDDPVTRSMRSLASGNNDASLLLYYLLGAPGPAGLVGEETIGGVPTRRLGTPLDLDRALALVPDEIRDTLAANIAEVRAGGVDPVLEAEIWVDGRDLVRRVRFGYTLGDAMGGGTMDVTFDFREHGAPLDLGVPEPGDAIPVEDLVRLDRPPAETATPASASPRRTR